MSFHFGSYPNFSGVRAAAAKPNNVNRGASSALEMQNLRSQVERLYMITEALWLLLKRDGHHGDEELGKLIEEIDLRDGNLDGRMASVPAKCPSCSRTVSARTGACIYCGTRPDSSQVF